MLQLNEHSKPIHNEDNLKIIFKYLMFDIIDKIKDPDDLNFIGGVYFYYMRNGRISALQFLAIAKVYIEWYAILGEVAVLEDIF